jgi:hypothetical protein
MSEPRKITSVWTWRCRRCGQNYATTLGFRWVVRDGKRTRICFACAEKADERRAAKLAAASVVRKT